MSFPMPPNEQGRLRRLRDYRILDTEPEKRFDDLTFLASYICGCPVAMINLIDSDRQWTKSVTGYDINNIPREHSFCSHTITVPELLIVEDLLDDPRFDENPYVTGSPNVRFYAGVPVFSSDGFALGTLCVLDTKPRKLSPEQTEAMKALARQVHDQMELRKNLAELRTTLAEKDTLYESLESNERKFRSILDTSRDGILVERDEEVVYMNPAYAELFGYSHPSELTGKFISDLAAPEDLGRLIEYGKKRKRGEEAPTLYEFKIKQKDGTLVDLEASVSNFDQGGEHFIITFARDIRERKQHEKERESLVARVQDALTELTEAHDRLHEQEQRYRKVLETSLDAILIEENERVVYMNQIHAELFGYSSPDELKGVHISELAAPEDIDRLVEYSNRRKRGQPAPSHYHFKVKHRLGELIDLEASVSSFRQNDRLFIITFARDIRERKRHEQERERLITELTDALGRVKTLQGLLPICASCKKIRDDKGYWSQIEEYIITRTDADFTHGICPDCARRLYPEAYED